MTQKTEIHDSPAQPSAQQPEPTRRLKFGKNDGFQVELRRRVDEFFRDTGRRQRDCPQMYLKTVALAVCFVASYALLVFVARAWWQAVPRSATSTTRPC